MVVCKCRKATKLYCFVHKVPVCGECICFPEHQICVVRTYSEWVIDGEYDWPSKCCSCHAVLEEAAKSHTTRLGCLHIIHTSCLLSHIKSFPPHTAPAGYVCPTCSIPIWPPKSVKDLRSRLHSMLKEEIVQLNATTRKIANHEKQNSENFDYADDEDGNQKKYSRRGTFRNKFFRSLLPFWSSALPILPVTAPPRKDSANDGPEGRLRHHKSSRTDPRKLLLLIAILACMATMGILYYRLAQGGLAEELPGEEQ